MSPVQFFEERRLNQSSCCFSRPQFTGEADLNPGLVIVKELEILGAYATTQAELNEALRLVETGAIRSWVSDVLPLSEAARAHDRLEKKEVAGRLVLEPVH